MSFILDALRKAEDKNRDRHSITVPSRPHVLNDELPEASPAERNSAWVLMLLGAVLASALWWFLQQRTTKPQASMPTVSTESSAQRSASVQNVTTPVNTVERAPSPPSVQQRTPRPTGARALDREARRGAASAAPSVSTQTAATDDEPNSKRVNTSTSPVTPGTVRILQADGSSTQSDTSRDRQRGQVQEESLPDYRQSLTSGEVPIPELHLDIHVYSAEADKRFVFINLNKYTEGEAIDKDTAVESIEPEGAVINHKGFRFVLRPD